MPHPRTRPTLLPVLFAVALMSTILVAQSALTDDPPPKPAGAASSPAQPSPGENGAMPKGAGVAEGDRRDPGEEDKRGDDAEQTKIRKDWMTRYEERLDDLVERAVREGSTATERRALDKEVGRLVSVVLREDQGDIPGGDEVRRILKGHRTFEYFAGEQRVELPLEEALRMALNRNISLAQSGLSFERSGWSVVSADSAFEPSLTAGFTGSASETPTTSALAGGDVVINRTVSYNAGVSKLWSLGTTTALSYSVQRQSSNNTFVTVNPNFSQSATFSLTQPLLRNFGFDSGESSYRQAVLTEKSARLTLEDARISTIAQAEQAYWKLVLAYDDLLVTLVSFIQSQDLVRINTAKQREGLVAKLDVTSAEKQRMDSVEAVINAQNALVKAQDALLQLIAPSDDPAGWRKRFIPVTRPSPLSEARDLDPREQIDIALRNRPDVRRGVLDVRTKDIALAAARDAWWPQVDFTGSFTYIGVDKNYPTSVYGIRDRDSFQYSLGVNVGVPLGNRAATASLRQAEIDKADSAESLRATRSSAIQEVRGAFLDLQAALTRMQVTDAGRILAREQYQGEKKKLRAGLSTTFQVTEMVKQRLSAAKAHLKAVTDAQIASSSLERAKGTLRLDLVGK